jgi:hypothetical protein
VVTVGSKFRRLAPYFLIGPIGGPLLAGVVINLQAGRRVLSALYLMALVEYWVLLPLVTAKLGVHAYHLY